MANFNILDLEPSKISKDLRGKYIMIYSLPKAGKTSFSAEAPKNIIAGFEIGWHGLDGVKAVPLTSWSEFKTMVAQLKRQEAKEMYHTVTVDTVAIAYQKCEEFITHREGVDSIRDIPWGQGWNMLKKEFSDTLRQITLLGYGLILIAHSKEKSTEMVDSEGNKIMAYAPDLPEAAYQICNGIVDLIGYISVEFDDEGKSHRYLYTRQTPRVFAGSRWKYLDTRIPFGYEELVDAIGRAIEKQAEVDGISVLDNQPVNAGTEKRPFEDVQKEGKELWETLIEKNPANAQKILSIVEKVFNKKIKLSEIPESQQDLFETVIEEMKSL